MVAIAQTLFAILAFLVPLWGIHRKILTEKEAALQENGALIERAYQELQGLLENKDYQSMDMFNSGVSSLLAFQAELEKVPTWPWQPQTLRGFLSAVFLPIALWLIQRILTQVL